MLSSLSCLAMTTCLEVGVAVGDVGLDPAEEVDRGAVELHEDPVLDLAEAEELQDLLHLGRDAVDTPDPHHEGHLLLL